jgi:hypothetical protein
MGTRSKGVTPIPIAGGDPSTLAETSKELLRLCLKSVHDLSRCYFYTIKAEESIPGSLSYLLNISAEDLVEILKNCGFYNVKKGAFLFGAFRIWVAASTTQEFSRSLEMSIGGRHIIGRIYTILVV